MSASILSQYVEYFYRKRLIGAMQPNRTLHAMKQLISPCLMFPGKRSSFQSIVSNNDVITLPITTYGTINPMRYDCSHSLFIEIILRFDVTCRNESPHTGVEDVNDSLLAPETSLLADNTEASAMAAAASKVARTDGGPDVNSKKAAASSSDDDGIFTLLYTAFKKVAVVGAVYLVGYMGWSVAWLITPVVFAVTREYWRKKADLRRGIAKASAMANEKDVILARIDDLPAWVYFPDVERCEWINRVSFGMF